MGIPYICENCEREQEFISAEPLYKTCSYCRGVMSIVYQDNYERVAEVFPCHTCVHASGDGEKCNYCNNI